MALGEISDIVGLTTTFMDIAGFGFGNEDKPRWDEVLGKLDDALTAIGAVDGKVDTAIGMLTTLGDTMQKSFDELNGEVTDTANLLSATFVAQVEGKVAGAQDSMVQALAASDPALRTSLIAQAMSQSNEAIRTISEPVPQGIAVGAIASVGLMHIALVEQLGDGAFATEPYKSQMLSAADALRASVADAVDHMEWKGGSWTVETWSDGTKVIDLTNVTGSYHLDNFGVYSDGFGEIYPFSNTIFSVLENSGIGGVRQWLQSLTFEQIRAEIGNDEYAYRYVDDMIHRLDFLRSADTAAAHLDDLKALADQWTWLASGQHLEGGDGADAITAPTGFGSSEETYRDVLDGYGGADTLTGGTQDNAIRGGDGDDVLDGQGGSDVLRGGDGADILIGGLGGDTIDGGAGVDTANYSGATAGVTVNLGLTGRQITGDGGDTLIDVENLVGSAFNDTLTGGAGANLLAGGNGDDHLSGGSSGADTLVGGLGYDTLEGGDGVGADTADYSAETRAIQIAMKGIGSGTAMIDSGSGFVAEDALTGIENLTGGQAGDSLTGDKRNNVLVGGAGADTLVGGGGADKLYGDDKSGGADSADKQAGGDGDDVFYRVSAGSAVDTLTGGTGRDTFSLDWKAGAQADVATDFQAGFGGDFISLAFAGKADAQDGFASGLFRLVQQGSDTLLQVDADKTAAVAYQTVLVLQGVQARTLVDANFTPTGHFEQKGWDLLGGLGADTIVGTAFGEMINGSDGGDFLQGLGGMDSIEGGANVDTADYREKTAAIKVTLGASNWVQLQVGGAVEDSLRNVENIFGGSKGDSLTGDARDNLFRGGGGADTLDGSRGTDIADYRDKTAAVSVTLAGAANAVVSVNGAAEDTLRNIEGVYGGSAGDTLTGDTGANVLAGGGGADVLVGGGGADRFVMFTVGDSSASAGGRDRIADFSHGDGDRIDLSALDADTSTAAVDDKFTLVAAFTHHAGELVQQAKAGGVYLVSGDVDGDGVADFSLSVTASAKLVAADFVL